MNGLTVGLSRFPELTCRQIRVYQHVVRRKGTGRLTAVPRDRCNERNRSTAVYRPLVGQLWIRVYQSPHPQDTRGSWRTDAENAEDTENRTTLCALWLNHSMIGPKRLQREVMFEGIDRGAGVKGVGRIDHSRRASRRHATDGTVSARCFGASIRRYRREAEAPYRPYPSPREASTPKHAACSSTCTIPSDPPTRLDSLLATPCRAAATTTPSIPISDPAATSRPVCTPISRRRRRDRHRCCPCPRPRPRARITRPHGPSPPPSPFPLQAHASVPNAEASVISVSQSRPRPVSPRCKHTSLSTQASA